MRKARTEVTIWEKLGRNGERQTRARAAPFLMEAATARETNGKLGLGITTTTLKLTATTPLGRATRKGSKVSLSVAVHPPSMPVATRSTTQKGTMVIY